MDVDALFKSIEGSSQSKKRALEEPKQGPAIKRGSIDTKDEGKVKSGRLFLDAEKQVEYNVLWFKIILTYLSDIYNINIRLRADIDNVDATGQKMMRLLPSEELLNDLVQALGNVAVIDDTDSQKEIYNWIVTETKPDILALLARILVEHPNLDIKFQVLSLLNDIVSSDMDNEAFSPNLLYTEELFKVRIAIIHKLLVNLQIHEVVVSLLHELSNTPKTIKNKLVAVTIENRPITDLEKLDFHSKGITLLVSLVISMSDVYNLEWGTESENQKKVFNENAFKSLSTLAHSKSVNTYLIHQMQFKKLKDITVTNQYAAEFYSQLAHSTVFVSQAIQSPEHGLKIIYDGLNNSLKEIEDPIIKAESFAELALIVYSKFKKPTNRPLSNTVQEEYFLNFTGVVNILLLYDYQFKREIVSYEGINLVMLILKNYTNTKNYYIEVPAEPRQVNDVQAPTRIFDGEQWRKSFKWAFKTSFQFLYNLLVDLNSSETRDEGRTLWLAESSSLLINLGFLKYLLKTLMVINGADDNSGLSVDTILLTVLFPLSSHSTKQQSHKLFFLLLLVLLKNLSFGSNERLRLMNKFVSSSSTRGNDFLDLKKIIVIRKQQLKKVKPSQVDRDAWDLAEQKQYVFSEEYQDQVAQGLDIIRQIDMLLYWLMLEDPLGFSKDIVSLIDGLVVDPYYVGLQNMKKILQEYKWELEERLEELTISESETLEIITSFLESGL